MDHQALKNWFLNEARDMPWRRDPSPYAVWVSEVMLQQTQVSVVIPYFERWMELFPSVEALAEAPLDQVIKVWEGLGYYSRARNLHEGARMVMQRFGGGIPQTEEGLTQIKGLGPYTVGAIRAFAFKQRAAAVDGNVIRVLSRYWAIEDDISKPSVVARIRQRAQEALPAHEPWVVAEALIELGATICSRKPQCHKCPLNSSCSAFHEGKAQTLPNKSKRVATTPLFRAVAVIRHQSYVLARRCGEGEIMSGLHEFPYLETDKKGLSMPIFKKKLEGQWGLELTGQEVLESVTHSFTRYRVNLSPALFHSHEKKPVDGYDWISIQELTSLAFSSGHRRVMASLLQRII